MKIGSVRNAQQKKQCVYSIQCDSGRCNIGETRRHLEVRIKEQKYNLTQGLLEISKLAQHAYKEGQKICGNEANVFRFEPSTILIRIYTESAHMSLLHHPISQPTWTPVMTAEVRKLQLRPVQIQWENLYFLCWYHTEASSL
jgi:hypothetical protein